MTEQTSGADHRCWLDDIELGVGAWSWGDRLFWQYGSSHSDEDVREAFQASVEHGARFFDTAEIYGLGRSEKFLGDLIQTTEEDVLVTTKFMPYPWRLTQNSLLSALEASLKRLQLEQVDLYLVHQPLPPIPVETWANALATAVERGLVRAVGLSNYDRERMLRAYEVLDKRGVHLAANQVRYNLLDRSPEKNGVVSTCQELGTRLIAYSPLAMGVLTGKYGPDNLPGGLRRMLYRRGRLEELQPLLDVLEQLADKHDKTQAQVSINWLICRGALAIPGAKNARQARENAEAASWRLTEADVALLSEASAKLQE